MYRNTCYYGEVVLHRVLGKATRLRNSTVVVCHGSLLILHEETLQQWGVSEVFVSCGLKKKGTCVYVRNI